MNHLNFIKLKTTWLYIICFSFFINYFQSSCSSKVAQNQASNITTEQVIYRNQKFDIVTIDLQKTPIQFYWKNKEGKLIRSLKNLKKVVEQDGKQLHFAMNAGMYQRDRNPQGLYIEDGKIIKPLDTLQSGYGNFYLQPNGVFFIDDQTAGVLPSTVFSKQKATPKRATQSGPMLVINDKIHPIFTEGSSHLNIRNGVGMISEHEVVFAISHTEVNLFDFAMFFKEKLNCKNALYLDGFVSRAYIPSLQRLDLDGDFGVIIGVTN